MFRVLKPVTDVRLSHFSSNLILRPSNSEYNKTRTYVWKQWKLLHEHQRAQLPKPAAIARSCWNAAPVKSFPAARVRVDAYFQIPLEVCKVPLQLATDSNESSASREAELDGPVISPSLPNVQPYLTAEFDKLTENHEEVIMGTEADEDPEEQASDPLRRLAIATSVERLIDALREVKPGSPRQEYWLAAAERLPALGRNEKHRVDFFGQISLKLQKILPELSPVQVVRLFAAGGRLASTLPEDVQATVRRAVNPFLTPLLASFSASSRAESSSLGARQLRAATLSKFAAAAHNLGIAEASVLDQLVVAGSRLVPNFDTDDLALFLRSLLELKHPLPETLLASAAEIVVQFPYNLTAEALIDLIFTYAKATAAPNEAILEALAAALQPLLDPEVRYVPSEAIDEVKSVLDGLNISSTALLSFRRALDSLD